MNLGSVELALGDYASATDRFEDGYARFSQRFGAEHPATLRAGVLLTLARLDAGDLPASRFDEAQALLIEVSSYYRPEDPERTAVPLGEALIARAQIEALRGRCPEARALLSDAATHLPKELATDPLVGSRRARVLQACD